MSLKCVYIMASRSHRLYTGVTGHLVRRVLQHKEKMVRSFTARYDMTRLVYYECGTNILGAIAREKQIKGWSRQRKLELIRSMNPTFKDLSEGWYESGEIGRATKIRDSAPLRGSE